MVEDFKFKTCDLFFTLSILNFLLAIITLIISYFNCAGLITIVGMLILHLNAISLLGNSFFSYSVAKCLNNMILVSKHMKFNSFMSSVGFFISVAYLLLMLKVQSSSCLMFLLGCSVGQTVQCGFSAFRSYRLLTDNCPELSF